MRYDTGEEEPLRFYGHALMTLGKDATGYQEFEADSVKKDEEP